MPYDGQAADILFRDWRGGYVELGRGLQCRHRLNRRGIFEFGDAFGDRLAVVEYRLWSGLLAQRIEFGNDLGGFGVIGRGKTLALADSRHEHVQSGDGAGEHRQRRPGQRRPALL